MLRRDPRRVLQVPIIPLEIIDDCWKEPETFMDRLRARCYISSNRYRRVLIEFLCTAIFVYGGLSSGAQRAISNFSSHDWLGMCIGWGISLALSIQLASNISGGHLNPAISLHFLSMGRLCIYDFLLYTVAQICGAYVGSALMYVTYYDGLHALMDTKMDDIVMMKLFAPYPAPNTTIIGGLLDQIMGTAYFSICLSSITDVRNGVPSFLQPTFIGLNLMLIGIFAGYHFGFAINPARDLGSRLFALSIGFGRRTFLHDGFHWWWITLFGPMVGGVCGAWLYQFFIGFHLVNAETVASSPLQSVTSDEASGKIHCTVQSTTVEHSPISDEKIVPGLVPGKNRPKRANGILDAVGESPTKDTSDYVEYLRPRFQLKNDLYRCVLCEFFCTALLLFGGTATNARHTLMNSNRWIDISFGWGFSLFYAVLVGFKISGSHLNPAVSLNVYTAGKISFMRFLLYSIAQILGGYFGSLLTFLMYIDYFLDDRSMANAGIFSTYPRAYLSVIGGVVDQVIGTAFLCFILGGITDPHNWIPSYLQPLLIGILVLLIGTAIGINSGYAINPARDLGPRLFTLSAGWGAETFTYRGGMWFWVPVVCPLIGGLLGAWMYTVFIGLQIHSKRHENS